MEFISSFSVGLITNEQINFYLSNGYLVIKETRARGGGGRVEGRQKRIFFVVFLDDKLRFL